MNYSQFIPCFLTVILAPCVLHAQASVVMKGTTSYFRDRDDRGERLPQDEQGYQPLPNVRVKAFRRAVIGTDTSRFDGNDARYDLNITEGPPFHVLFHEDNLVPDLKTLTADSKKEQYVHVTLLTPRQFDEIFGREELVNHLRKIMRLLRHTEGVTEDEIRRLEQLFSRQFDVDTSER